MGVGFGFGVGVGFGIGIGKVGRQLEALRFAAREKAGGLPETEVAQSDVLKGLRGVVILRCFGKVLKNSKA